jgi:hypothetical protein
VPPSTLGRVSKGPRIGTPSRHEAVDPRPGPEHPLAQALLRTLAYADVFDHPLTLAEAHRYLVGVSASAAEVRDELQRLVPERLSRCDSYLMLRGREDLVETRRRRQAIAAEAWPAAVRYARTLARLPFVRMVAVTGSLSRDNVEPGSDVDYLVVTEPGRVWVARGFTGLVARHGRRRGVGVCPNYVLSREALTLADRNLVTAHELVQMVPLAGYDVYRQMRDLNAWTAGFLPNAGGDPRPLATVPGGRPRLAEAVLRTPLGGAIDRLERRRFERMLHRRTSDPSEVVYSAECFKDHIDGWARRIRAAYFERAATLGIDP